MNNKKLNILIFSLVLMIFFSCSKKKYEMESVKLTKKQIEICFKQDMSGLNLKMEFELLDGSKITENDNIFFCIMRFDENTNCIKGDKTLWNDRYLKPERKEYWENLKTSDIKLVKWKIYEFVNEPITKGILTLN